MDGAVHKSCPKYFQKKNPIYLPRLQLHHFQNPVTSLKISQNIFSHVKYSIATITVFFYILDLGKSFVVVAQITDRKPRSRSPSKKRRPTAVEREAQEKIDRENRILLKKILEQHHGIRRSSSIPPASALNQNHHPPK